MAELRGVSYAVGGVMILDRVSVRFRPGRFNVIIGPNGAGKSTLLKIATGLIAPTVGEVLFDERPVSSIPHEDLARSRAVLSQHVELAFPLPVSEVVMMGRYPHFGRVPASRDREIVDRSLEIVGMTAKRDQPYPTLSGGEQQKAQLARVMAQIWNDPPAEGAKVLFLDEPTTSLDVHYEIHLLDIARGLLAKNCTIIAVMHDINVALHYGDSFFVMNEGRVVRELDDPSEVTGDLLEEVFKVRAHRVTDATDGQTLWKFGL